MEKLNGIELIAQERREQIEVHKFDVRNDQYYSNRELSSAAIWALTGTDMFYPENWEDWFKDKMESKKRRMPDAEFEIEKLKIAGALIAAEIDRLQALEG